VSKSLAFVLGGYCIYTKRQHLMRLANYWYSGLVVWNLIIILVLTTGAPLRHIL